jgi:hypothetical protein
LNNDIMPQVENSTPDFTWQVAVKTQAHCIKLLSGYLCVWDAYET